MLFFDGPNGDGGILAARGDDDSTFGSSENLHGSRLLAVQRFNCRLASDAVRRVEILFEENDVSFGHAGETHPHLRRRRRINTDSFDEDTFDVNDGRRWRR